MTPFASWWLAELKARELTESDVARLLTNADVPTTPQAIQQWKKGSVPQFRRFLKLCEVLDLDVVDAARARLAYDSTRLEREQRQATQ